MGTQRRRRARGAQGASLSLLGAGFPRVRPWAAGDSFVASAYASGRKGAEETERRARDKQVGGGATAGSRCAPARGQGAVSELFLAPTRGQARRGPPWPHELPRGQESPSLPSLQDVWGSRGGGLASVPCWVASGGIGIPCSRLGAVWGLYVSGWRSWGSGRGWT